MLRVGVNVVISIRMGDPSGPQSGSLAKQVFYAPSIGPLTIVITIVVIIINIVVCC